MKCPKPPIETSERSSPKKPTGRFKNQRWRDVSRLHDHTQTHHTR